MIQRIKDWLRERRIQRLKSVLFDHPISDVPTQKYLDMWDQLRIEVNARTAQQIERMNRSKQA